MARSPRRQTFADLVQEPTWSETDASHSGQYAPRPGRFNGAGEFFDPDGIKLRLVAEHATKDEAQALIESGAAVVAEVCGCGGFNGDCTPDWVTHDQLRELRRGLAPELAGRDGVPTWIDVWANDHGTVVFAHGDVSWGNALT
jgi:hypothetical protein